MSDKVISSTTQEFLDVYDIINDMVLLKDGTASIILQIGTMNFSLLAEQEQDAVIFTYGSLLNSLNYPIQINIQSQTKDATKYLRLLDEQVQKASSDRKAALIKQYRDFVATLIRERNVLQKRFYISVPASPGEMGMISPSGVLPGKTGFDASTVEKSTMLEKAMNVLEPRKDHLTAQFNRLGLFARQLTTQEIIQNFYINYNPEAAEGQEISSSENYATPLVRASFGKKFMPNDQTVPTNPINPQGQILQNLTTQSQDFQNTITASTEPSPADILSDQPLQKEALPELTTEQIDQPVQPIIETVPDSIPDSTNVEINSIDLLNTAAIQPNPVSSNEFQAPINPTLESTPLAEPQSFINQEQNIDLQQPVVFQQPTDLQQPITSGQTVNVEPTIAQEIDLKLDANLINNGQNSLNAEQIIEAPVIFSDPTIDQAPIQEIQEIQESQQTNETIAPESIAPKEKMDDFAEEITSLQIQNNFNASTAAQSQPINQNQGQIPEQQV